MTMLQSDVAAPACTVFLVEDDDGVRSALRFLLESEGLTVRAYSCPEGLLTEGGTRPDGCLVTDYNMPGMNRLELVSALRKRGDSMPAILVTSDSNVGNVENDPLRTCTSQVHNAQPAVAIRNRFRGKLVEKSRPYKAPGVRGVKKRTGDPWIAAADYGALLPQFTVNLIVRGIDRALEFYLKVLRAQVHYSDPDFAALRVLGIEVMLHADHTYEHNPWSASLQDGQTRGLGAELRLPAE